MTVNEAAASCGISPELIEKYACNAAGEVDCVRLSILSTLNEIGFSAAEIEDYMLLLLSEKETCAQRKKMLRQKRNGVLDEIHSHEKCLCRIDYLRHEIEKKEKTE